MSAASDCNCACPTPTITEIPGTDGGTGAAGASGTNGLNSYTTTVGAVGPFNKGDTGIAITVASASWVVNGQTIFIESAGYFSVTSHTTSVITCVYLNITSNTNGTSTATSKGVSPAGPRVSITSPSAIVYSALTAVGAVDNLSVTAGVGAYNITFPCHPATGTAAGEVVTEYTIGHKFRIIAWAFVPTVAMVGGSRVFNMEIDTTDVGTTPSTVTIPATAIGVVIPGTTVAGANTGSATQKFSIEVAAGGTSLSAGEGYFIVSIQNMDSADAVASLSDHVNDLITALT